MPSQKRIKVIFDTNIWISFLIGKRLTSLKEFISNGKVQIVLTDQLIKEIEIVTQRPKLQKYFHYDAVQELILLWEAIGQTYKIKSKYDLCRDAKDNFLLDLIEESKADYVVTGDADLLEIREFLTAKIITPKDFERIIEITFHITKYSLPL
jgi:putative PIN family toxin of toxin-antitoxin system